MQQAFLVTWTHPFPGLGVILSCCELVVSSDLSPILVWPHRSPIGQHSLSPHFNYTSTAPSLVAQDPGRASSVAAASVAAL